MADSLSSICVFCGSCASPDPAFAAAADRVGELLAEAGITLVYGAGRSGMMGALVEGALSKGGSVIGVTHKREVMHAAQMGGLTRLEVCETLPERKARMVELADAFIVLPGGYGTMDELFEILAWTQIGLQSKPIALLNVKGYFDLLLQWLDRAASEKYIRPEDRTLFIVEDDAERLLQRLGRE